MLRHNYGNYNNISTTGYIENNTKNIVGILYVFMHSV